jgi:ABC-type maltose transport system permease subunit
VKRKTSQRLLDLLVWAIVAVTLSPVAFMVYASLSDYNDVVTGHLLDAGFTPRWSNYREMWVNVDFLSFLRNSLVICGATTLLSTLLASLAAYSLARFKFRGNHPFSVAVSTTQVIPGMLFFLPLYMLYIQLDDAGLPMMNTFHGMIFLYTAMFTPASIWIMRGFFVSIPRELEEAAIIDGCSRLGAFVRIVLQRAGPHRHGVVRLPARLGRGVLRLGAHLVARRADRARGPAPVHGPTRHALRPDDGRRRRQRGAGAARLLRVATLVHQGPGRRCGQGLTSPIRQQ